MSVGSAPSSPARPDLAFRVGIVGHRPNRLPKEADKLDALRRMLRSVLAAVRAAVHGHAARPAAETQFSAAAPVLRAVSPLAEGTDRMFADAALDLGYALCCPMPFAQAEFEKDFMPPKAMEAGSVARFRAILERAHTGAGLATFELDGDRADKDVYGVAGRVVLNQSDLLVVVWDGHEPAGKGGTVDTLRDAVKYHLPVLWIDALDPEAWQLLRTEQELEHLDFEQRCTPQRKATGPYDLQAAVTAVVKGEIALPEEKSEQHREPSTRSRAPQYFNERKPFLNLAFTWKLFRDFWNTGKIRRPKFLVADFVDDIRSEWPVRGDPGVDSISDVEDWVHRRLRVHYAWSDKRGDLYADAYRSAYVLSYFLSAWAVLVALVPMTLGWGHHDSGVVYGARLELAIVLLIVGMFAWGGWIRHWHERWMEYRLLAELIRQLRFLIPLGGGRPFPHVPIHLAGYGDPTQTWMSWHMRAIARATGIPDAKVTPAYVKDCLDNLAKVISEPRTGQRAFHAMNEERSENIAHRLHVTAFVLFILTTVGIGLHLGLNYVDEHTLKGASGVPALLTLVSASLPAFGAALVAINNQGEFSRLAKRSAGMVDGFERFEETIQKLRASAGSGGPRLSQVIPLARDVADMMVNEVSDWRVVFIDRPQPTA
jgi:hypothetical protein